MGNAVRNREQKEKAVQSNLSICMGFGNAITSVYPTGYATPHVTKIIDFLIILK